MGEKACIIFAPFRSLSWRVLAKPPIHANPPQNVLTSNLLRSRSATPSARAAVPTMSSKRLWVHRSGSRSPRLQHLGMSRRTVWTVFVVVLAFAVFMLRPMPGIAKAQMPQILRSSDAQNQMVALSAAVYGGQPRTNIGQLRKDHGRYTMP